MKARRERTLRRLREAALRFGLSVSEAERLVADARRQVAAALAAGLRPHEVRCLVTSDGAGSVALFVGDEASVIAGSAAREAAVLEAMPSRAVH